MTQIQATGQRIPRNGSLSDGSLRSSMASPPTPYSSSPFSTPSALSKIWWCRRPSTAGLWRRYGEALIVNVLLMSLFRHSAQRHGAPAVQAMVDAIRAALGRAHHLRAVRQSRAGTVALAMAADVRPWCGRSPIRASPWR